MVRSLCVLVATLFVIAIAPPDAFAGDARKREITTDDLARLADIDGLSVSPDGEVAAALVRRADAAANTYVSEWILVSTTSGAVRRLADAGKSVLDVSEGRRIGVFAVVSPAWTSDSRFIAFARQEGEWAEIWRGDRSARNLRRVARIAARVLELRFSNDGRRLLVRAEPTERQRQEELAQEGRSGFHFDRRFFPGYDRSPLLPPDLEPNSPRVTDAERARRQQWVVDVARGTVRTATAEEAAEIDGTAVIPPFVNGLAFRGWLAGSETTGWAWTEARDAERSGARPPLTLVARRHDGGETETCAAEACVTQAMRGVWWLNEAEVLFAVGEGARFQDTALYRWRVGEDRVSRVLRSPAAFGPSPWPCMVAQGKLICLLEESDRPRRLVQIDPSTGQVDTLFDPNPDFQRFNLGLHPQLLEFTTAAGVQAFGYLVLPPQHDGRALPLVIVTYSCRGFLRGGTGNEYPIYPMAAAGFAVLCFDPGSNYESLAVRSAADHQIISRGPGDPEKRRVQQALDAAVDQLAATGVIDPERVALTGLSFGGEMVFYALFNMRHLAAAISSGGEVGPSSTFLYPVAGVERLQGWGLQSPTSARWDDLSITRNAHRVRAPLLINAADHELLSVLDAYWALSREGRAVDLYVYPEEYHVKWQPAHRLAIYDRNIRWLEFWLMNEGDAESFADHAEFERWRSLRLRLREN